MSSRQSEDLSPKIHPSEKVDPAEDGIEQSPVLLSEVELSADARRKPTVSDYFTLFASGCALFSDGYQNSLMTAGNALFKILYPTVFTSVVSTRVSNASIVGSIIGQIVVGICCDRWGRKKAIVGTTIMIVIGAILQTASSPTSNIEGLFWMMTVARGITGIGVGGEYPASSTSASEAANELFGKNRGAAFIMVTNFVLSIGGPVVLSLTLLMLGAQHYGGTKSVADLHKLSVTWRVLFAIGAVWPLAVFYFRIRMVNSKLYRRNAVQHNVPYKLIIKKYWRTLLGTAGTWFIYDFVVFPNSLFSSTIIAAAIPGAGLMKTLEWQLLLSVLSIPGVLLGALFVKRLGRRNLLLIGFSGYLLIGIIIFASWEKMIKIIPLFVVFFAIFTGVGSFGPGNCEGTISAESYPTLIRGTMYGISAAVGKTGAAVGTAVFTIIQTNLGKKYTFLVSAMCGIVGVLLAWLFVVDKTNEDLALEDELFRQYLVENGWKGEMGDGSEGLKRAEELEDDRDMMWSSLS